MVERMKKVSILVHHVRLKEIIEKLQKAGVMHLDLRETRETPEARGLRDRLSALRRLSTLLGSLKKDENGAERLAGATPPRQGTPPPSSSPEPPGDLKTEEFFEKWKSLEELLKERERLERDRELLSHFGEFDPGVAAKLGEAGVLVVFFRCPRKTFHELESSGGLIVRASAEKEAVYGVEIARGESGRKTPGELEVKVPAARLTEVEDAIRGVQAGIGALKRELCSWERRRPDFEREAARTKDRLAYETALCCAEGKADGTIYTLQGWVPAKNEGALKRSLQEEALVCLTWEPAREDTPPVLLSNNPFARLFEPILKIFSLPGYHELDTTPFFAPFYMLFFGLCVADVGYGLILFFALFGALAFVKNRHARSIAILGLCLSFSVIVCGILLNDAFGIPLFGVEGAGEAKRTIFSSPSRLAAVVKPLVVFGDIRDAMRLPLLLGVVQVLFGFALRVFNKIKRHGFLAALQPIGTFLMLTGVVLLAGTGVDAAFSLGPIPLGRFFTAFKSLKAVPLTAALFGLALLLAFNGVEHGTKPFLRPLTGLWELYGLATGIPGDILSYLRLFALGLAGGLLGEAMNTIALMVRGDSPAGFVFMVVVLVGGHALNFGIGLLSAFVHSLRLTFVEFYKSVGFAGGGTPYKPFMLEEAKE